MYPDRGEFFMLGKWILDLIILLISYLILINTYSSQLTEIIYFLSN